MPCAGDRITTSPADLAIHSTHTHTRTRFLKGHPEVEVRVRVARLVQRQAFPVLLDGACCVALEGDVGPWVLERKKKHARVYVKVDCVSQDHEGLLPTHLRLVGHGQVVVVARLGQEGQGLLSCPLDVCCYYD